MDENDKLRLELIKFAQWLRSNDKKDNPLGLSPESTRGYILNEFYAHFADLSCLPTVTLCPKGWAWSIADCDLRETDSCLDCKEKLAPVLLDIVKEGSEQK